MILVDLFLQLCYLHIHYRVYINYVEQYTQFLCV